MEKCIMITQINLLSEVSPMGPRLIAIDITNHQARILAELRARAPEWARFWAQNLDGSGDYWEYQPEPSFILGCWKESSARSQTQRYDLRLAGSWLDTLIEVKP